MDKFKTIVIGDPSGSGYRLAFPLDFAGTLCARDGIKTGSHTPNGEDAYDRKLVAMVLKRKKRKKVRCFENHGQDCRVREIDVAPTIPQKAGTGGNNLPIVCFSGPQDHCVTRGYMVECSPTLNAAAGMSGNNRPFIVGKRRVRAYGIDQQGGKGAANFTEDVAPTVLSDSHGTPHGVAIIL